MLGRSPGGAGDAALRSRLAEATAALAEGGAGGGLNKADLRRLARRRREAEWAAFSATRPAAAYDSPQDLAAIEVRRAGAHGRRCTRAQAPGRLLRP